ncbi:unnamed protein product, partial [Owenia fusiformis]
SLQVVFSSPHISCLHRRAKLKVRAAMDLPSTVQEVPTPCLLVDLDRVKKNCTAMRERCENLGLQLRCHMKTHKTLELGEIMTNGSKRCITVSTIKEAQFFADGGYDDILYAYPLTANKIPILQGFVNKLESFHVTVDSDYNLDILRDSTLNDGKKWSVFVMVDTGYGRDGVKWDDKAAVDFILRVNESPNIVFQGLYTHEGIAYNARGRDQLRTIGGTVVDNIASLAQRLKEAGIECCNVGIGSTPSASHPPSNTNLLTELHPGNYVFYDSMQAMIGSCTKDDIACRVATRVVNHLSHSNSLLIDCGWEGLSLDGKDELPTGFCMFQNNPNLKLVKMTQEIGTVQAVEGTLDFSKYPLGSMLYMYPYHACATASMHPVYYIHEGDNIIDTYSPCRGWY